MISSPSEVRTCTSSPATRISNQDQYLCEQAGGAGVGDRDSIEFRGLFTGNNICQLKRENMSAVVQGFGWTVIRE
jgi:hypothetical protein